MEESSPGHVPPKIPLLHGPMMLGAKKDESCTLFTTGPASGVSPAEAKPGVVLPELTISSEVC